MRKFVISDKIRIQADEGIRPTHCLIILKNIDRFMAGFVYAEVYAFEVTSL